MVARIMGKKCFKLIGCDRLGQIQFARSKVNPLVAAEYACTRLG